MRVVRHLQACIAAALLASAQVALASPSAKPAAKPEVASSAQALRAAEGMLESEDPAVVRKGIDALAELDSDAAAKALSARLRRGLPPRLIEPAVHALVRIGKQSAAPVLLELVLHRRAAVRQYAIDALAALEVRIAQSALLHALDDPSAEVREAAVLALAEVGDARALPALFAASERGVPHALTAIGKLATVRDVKAIVRRADGRDMSHVKQAMEVMLERKDFPMLGKVRMVNELAALAPEGARVHLVQWLDARKVDGDPRLRKALFDAIKRLDRVEAERAAQPLAKPEASGAMRRTTAPSKQKARRRDAESAGAAVAAASVGQKLRQR